MKRLQLLAIVALAGSSPAFAEDVDILPNGYVSSVIREAAAYRSAAPADSVGHAVTTENHPQKSRAQVKAETREASSLGLLSVGEGDPKQATLAQERQIEQAGLRALSLDTAAVR